MVPTPLFLTINQSKEIIRVTMSVPIVDGLSHLALAFAAMTLTAAPALSEKTRQIPRVIDVPQRFMKEVLKCFHWGVLRKG
jgi:hypothetical protein